MPQPKYIYNQKTLRFERAKTSILTIFTTTLGLLSVGFLFFVALTVAQNYLIETPLENSLRAENNALKDYKIELMAQLMSAESQMAELESKDRSLYEKIFETKKTDEQPAMAKSSKEILLADASGFHELTASLYSKFADLHSIAMTRNRYFAEKASIKKKDISLLTAAPTFAPIGDFDASKMVSGYGIRINPFHKGNYHHDGVDLAAPRGSEVLAAGPGWVTTVSYSDLQAGFGNYVEIEHGNGYVTRYANLGAIAVRYGQKISKGQSLGTIGISGGSVAPHVHYEVLKDGRNMDPVKFLMHGLSPDEYELIWQASRKLNQSMD